TTFVSFGIWMSYPICVSGVTTMKMISSTSSTSMSGVTFISQTWPPLPPTFIPIGSLLASGPVGPLAGLLLRDQTHRLEARVADRKHQLLDDPELQARVGLDDDRAG